MAWWKTAICASAVWFLGSLAVGIALVWSINAHLMGRQFDQARIGKAGEVTGMMAGIGIGIIWLGLFARSKLGSGSRR
jgi:hypothetical protein